MLLKCAFFAISQNYVRIRAARSHLHFHELRERSAKHTLPGVRLAQPLFPSVKVRRAQPPLPAEHRHTLPAPPLLAHQLPPLPPRLPPSFSSPHPPTLLYPPLPPQDALRVPLTHMLVHRLCFVIVIGVRELVRTGDGARGFIRLEAHIELLFAGGQRVVVQAAIADTPLPSWVYCLG